MLKIIGLFIFSVSFLLFQGSTPGCSLFKEEQKAMEDQMQKIEQAAKNFEKSYTAATRKKRMFPEVLSNPFESYVSLEKKQGDDLFCSLANQIETSEGSIVPMAWTNMESDGAGGANNDDGDNNWVLAYLQKGEGGYQVVNDSDIASYVEEVISYLSQRSLFFVSYMKKIALNQKRGQDFSFNFTSRVKCLHQVSVLQSLHNLFYEEIYNKLISPLIYLDRQYSAYEMQTLGYSREDGEHEEGDELEARESSVVEIKKECYDKIQNKIKSDYPIYNAQVESQRSRGETSREAEKKESPIFLAHFQNSNKNLKETMIDLLLEADFMTNNSTLVAKYEEVLQSLNTLVENGIVSSDEKTAFLKVFSGQENGSMGYNQIFVNKIRTYVPVILDDITNACSSRKDFNSKECRAAKKEAILEIVEIEELSSMERIFKRLLIHSENSIHKHSLNGKHHNCDMTSHYEEDEDSDHGYVSKEMEDLHQTVTQGGNVVEFTIDGSEQPSPPAPATPSLRGDRASLAERTTPLTGTLSRELQGLSGESSPVGPISGSSTETPQALPLSSARVESSYTFKEPTKEEIDKAHEDFDKAQQLAEDAIYMTTSALGALFPF